VGISCGGNGWIWYNFWWARSSHIACLEQPIITERRHYYEDWLGRFLSPKDTDSHSAYVDTTKECISIAWSEIMDKYNIGLVFDPGKGEVNLGLPFAWIRICMYKIRNLLK
jgi:hypothetical protein